MTFLRSIHCLAGILAAFATTCGAQDEILFSAEQWGDANLKLEQSADRVIESVLSGNANFEPLSRYVKGSRLRKLSRPVGRLDIRYSDGRFITCTGSLISEALLLTNYHCIPGTRHNRRITEASLLMGYYSIADTAGLKRYPVRINPIEKNKGLDYSILRVDGSPGADWGVVRLEDVTPGVGEALLVIHHPAGRPMHVTRGGCITSAPKAVENDDLYHKCDTLPGSSGAPIFSDDLGTVVALHYAGSLGPGPEQSNYGKLVRSIRSDSEAINKAIKSSKPRVASSSTPDVASSKESLAAVPERFESGAPPTPVPPQFKLFGETVRIVYTATRKVEAQALESELRQMYAKVSLEEVWSVPETFQNKIVSSASKLGVAKSIAVVTHDIAELKVLESVEQGDELVIWLGPP